MDALNQIWANIVHRYDDTTIDLVGNFIVQTLAYWVPSLFYLSIDLVPKHPLKSYKIQSVENTPTVQEIRHCVVVVLINQYLIAMPVDIALVILTKRLGQPLALRVSPTLPSLKEIVIHFSIMLLVREILFYHIHIWLHSPRMYKWIHSRHHQFTAPVAPASMYAHPIEHLLSNIIPAIAGFST